MRLKTINHRIDHRRRTGGRINKNKSSKWEEESRSQNNNACPDKINIKRQARRKVRSNTCLANEEGDRWQFDEDVNRKKKRGGNIVEEDTTRKKKRK